MFVEQIYETDIEDKFIDLYHRNASIYLPKNLTFRQSYKYGFRVYKTKLNILIPYIFIF